MANCDFNTYSTEDLIRMAISCDSNGNMSFVGAEVNVFALATDSEDGAVEFILTDSEDGTPEFITLDMEDR